MANQTEILEELKEAVIEGDDVRAGEAAKASLSSGIAPLDAITNGLMKGMSVVGEKFAKSELFVTNVMLSAEAMKAGMKTLLPKIKEGDISRVVAGRVVIGTVSGDIHDIGKNIVATLLEASNFQVYDLGTDVSAARFIEKAQETNAQIIAASALLSTTMPYQREIITVLNEMGLRDKYKVLVGGAPTTKEWAKEIGADDYGADAFEAVRISKKILETREQNR